VRVLAISGSLRRDSHNRRLLRAAADLLPPEAELVWFEGLKAIPPFDEDDEEEPALAVRRWRDAVAEADALLFATPEYNSSIPGQLKNAIDWASRPLATAALRNKPAAVIGTSTGMFGAVWAQAELRKSLAAAGARVIDRELPVALADDAFSDKGALVDRDQALELAEILVELLAAASEHAARGGLGSAIH
jgi:chromate reductase